ncbi:MAG: hypothetical protein ACR2NP_04845 [Pirellulaceae bacterium]
MLRTAEERFGERDQTYTFVGIEFGGESPQIWYPGDGQQIVIQLTPDCLTDVPRACYQLAHECIHLLAPTGLQNANNLEEGLATHYGEEYAARMFNAPRNCGADNYELAKRVTERALALNPAFVREIRAEKPGFCEFTPDDIVEHTRIGIEDAEFLCRTFY